MLTSIFAPAERTKAIALGRNGWTHGPAVAGFVIGAAGLVAFVVWELRSKHPMLPMEFFRNPSFSSGVTTVALFMMFGFFFLVTQYLQFVKGYSPLRAG